MAHDIQGVVWTVDTSATGLISSFPVHIDYIMITWKPGTAGALLIQELSSQGTTGAKTVLNAKTLGASSAAWDQLTQQFFFDRIFQNVWLTTATAIDSIQIYTE